MFSELWKNKVNKTALLTESTYVLSNQRSTGNYFEKTIFVSFVCGGGSRRKKCFIILCEGRISNLKNLCHFNRRQNSRFISISVLLIIKLIFQSLNLFSLNHLSHISASHSFSLYLFIFFLLFVVYLGFILLFFMFLSANSSFFSLKIHCQACKSSYRRSLTAWVWSPEPIREEEN